MPQITRPAVKEPPRPLMPPLVVYRDLWGNLTWAEVGGKRIVFEWLQEARDYAKEHGYIGITIQYR